MTSAADALDRLVASGPDPESARPRLERFREQGGALPDDEPGQALLAALLASGSFLPDILLSDLRRFEGLRVDPWLRRQKPRAVAINEIATAAQGAVSFVDLQRRLRLYRRREMLRLGARELMDQWAPQAGTVASGGTSLAVARELSALADGCLQAAVTFCDAALRATVGVPVSPEGTPSFVVMAMGKLGGEELNFSSDIDLIYVYSTDDGSAGPLSLHEYYARLAQAVTRALSDITDDGLIFRVDLRLRPEGRSGAICNSLAAAESYYESFGRTWERQALLRARPAAGDQALGERYLRTLEPFIHPRTAGANTIDDVRALRRLFAAEAEGDAFNVKLGKGGIRDIELVAQLLQLLYAGKRRELRERTTLVALHKLALAGLISDQEARVLSATYRFWRQIEHRLQLEHGSQTHQLPGSPEGREVLARRLRFAGEAALARELDTRRAAVSAIADTLGEPDAGPSTRVLRLLDPASPRARTEADLRAAGFQDPAAAADALELVGARLPAAWLEEALASPDPDRALAQFRDLALHGSLGLFTLLKEEPLLLRMLAGLFGTSERLSRHLVSNPALWVPLFEGLGAPSADPAEWQRDVSARLVGLELEEALRELRRFRSGEVLRIGLHDVAGNLAPEEVSEQLCAVAQLCVNETLRLVAEPLTARFGRPDTALTVLALGSFGARELRYGSDLDLVFLYACGGTTDQGMDHQEWFARLAQRLIGALSARMEEGLLYEVDTRLRPSGAQGMLVTSYDAFDRYHHEEAAPWERVALLRARPVVEWPAGSRDPLPAFGPLLEEITYQRPIDETALRNDLSRMRQRIETDRAGDRAGAVHLRFSAGGLTDLEFLAAWAQLRLGRSDAGLRTTSPLRALARLEERGELDPAVLEHYRFLRRASLRVRLLRDRPEDRVLPEDRPALARSLGLTTDELDAELAARRAEVRALFQKTLSIAPRD
jgi:glutamate-ammonia-ligase adenylyltransferase